MKNQAEAEATRERLKAEAKPPFEIGQKVKAGVAVRGPVLAIEKLAYKGGPNDGLVCWWVWVRNEFTGCPSTFRSDYCEAL